MPLLKGGYKHSKKIPPYGLPVKKIKRREKLGFGYESDVYAVDVVVETSRGERKLEMAEKRFRAWFKTLWSRMPKPFLNPRLQFELVNELIELNKRKKLGLRIVPTVRLRERTLRKPTLVMTKLNILKKKELTEQQSKSFWTDYKRQVHLLEREGYFSTLFLREKWSDVFKPVLDPQTGVCVAVLVDFGAIKKHTGTTFLERFAEAKK